MDETLALVRAGMTGALLGAFFYGGLWRRFAEAFRPAGLRCGLSAACFSARASRLRASTSSRAPTGSGSRHACWDSSSRA